MRSLSADQLIAAKGEVEQIASTNLSLKKQLDTLRANVLTQIQEYKTSHTAIRLYNSTS